MLSDDKRFKMVSSSQETFLRISIHISSDFALVFTNTHMSQHLNFFLKHPLSFESCNDTNILFAFRELQEENARLAS